MAMTGYRSEGRRCKLENLVRLTSGRRLPVRRIVR
jgi:hypothetical protein